MNIHVYETKKEMGQAAAEKAAEFLKQAIKEKGKARFIAATGASQFEFLDALTSKDEIDWEKTEMFHLDEYVGLSEDHKASFRKYLKKRLIEKVKPGEVHLIQGDAEDPDAESERVGRIINQEKVDVAFVGIGENGHIAFNDPPADFDTEKPYLIVDLDKKCRKQQVGEGWFESIEHVPTQAISMSVKQILKAKNIICTVPDKRKADAVKNCLSEDKEITPEYPSSILKKHDSVEVFLDKYSASLLNE